MGCNLIKGEGAPTTPRGTTEVLVNQPGVATAITQHKGMNNKIAHLGR